MERLNYGNGKDPILDWLKLLLNMKIKRYEIMKFVIYKIKYLLKRDYFKVYSSFNVKNFI